MVEHADRSAIDFNFGKHDFGSAWLSTPLLYLGDAQAAVELLNGMSTIRHTAGTLVEDRQRPALYNVHST